MLMPPADPASDTAPPLPSDGPPGFHLLSKPSGSTCNIDCTYCFFLSKEALYPNDKRRMSQGTLELYIRQLHAVAERGAPDAKGSAAQSRSAALRCRRRPSGP